MDFYLKSHFVVLGQDATTNNDHLFLSKPYINLINLANRPSISLNLGLTKIKNRVLRHVTFDLYSMLNLTSL